MINDWSSCTRPTSTAAAVQLTFPRPDLTLSLFLLLFLVAVDHPREELTPETGSNPDNLRARAASGGN